MPLPQEKPFERRLMETGACVTTCKRCHAAAGSAFWEFELDELEARHVCRVESVAAPLPLPAPLKIVRRRPSAYRGVPRRFA